MTPLGGAPSEALRGCEQLGRQGGQTTVTCTARAHSRGERPGPEAGPKKGRESAGRTPANPSSLPSQQSRDARRPTRPRLVLLERKAIAKRRERASGYHHAGEAGFSAASQEPCLIWLRKCNASS